MPAYKQTVKAELVVTIKANKHLTDRGNLEALLLLEQELNSLPAITFQMPNKGVQVTCGVRFHIKDFK